MFDYIEIFDDDPQTFQDPESVVRGVRMAAGSDVSRHLEKLTDNFCGMYDMRLHKLEI